MVAWECPTNPREEASGLDPEAIHLELLRAGVDADGIDVSAGMLERLREKARSENLDPSVRRADVTAFEREPLESTDQEMVWVVER